MNRALLAAAAAASALAGTAPAHAAWAPARAATAPSAAPAILDTAQYGRATLLLRRLPGGQRDLAFLAAPGAAPKVLTRRLPARATDVALGLDGGGRLIAVVCGRGGVFFRAVNAPGALRHVPATTSADRGASLFRGTLAFAHGASLRASSLTGAPVRTLWQGDGEWFAQDVAAGHDGVVAFVAVRDGAGNGAYQLLVAQPGHGVRRLLYLPLGDTHSGSLAIAGLDSSGRRLRVTRRFDDAVSHRTFSL